MQSAYFEAASEAWRAHLRNSGHPEYFWSAFASYRLFFASARPGTMRVAGQAAEIEAALAKFRAMYPSPVVPVTIGIGRAGSAGQGYGGRAHLAAEMFVQGQGIDTSELPPWLANMLAPPEAAVPAAIHEVVHTFQPAVNDPILLVECLREGAASFVAELVTGRPPSPALHAWCRPRAKALFREFARQAGSTSYEAWIRNAGQTSNSRPPDIGYWIGYEIVRSHHARARDKQAALRTIIDMHDPRLIVRESSYDWILRPPRGNSSRRRNRR